jgi:flagellar motor switch protein FliM
LKRAFRKDFTVELITVDQMMASRYKDQSPAENAFLAFDTEDRVNHGTLALPTATTQDWQTRLLGDASTHDESRTLSALEITLLSDVAVSLVAAFSSACQFALHAHPPLTVGHMTTPLEDTDELCAMTFQFKETKAPDGTAKEITLVMPCAQLAQSLKGLTRPEAKPEGNLTETMRQHVNHVPVTVTAEFARTRLTLEQAMDLHVGDVLLLEKELNDPITLNIDGRPVCYGTPGHCEDHYAVVITKTA